MYNECEVGFSASARVGDAQVSMFLQKKRGSRAKHQHQKYSAAAPATTDFCFKTFQYACQDGGLCDRRPRGRG